jgi:hypothetical protein
VENLVFSIPVFHQNMQPGDLLQQKTAFRPGPLL